MVQIGYPATFRPDEDGRPVVRFPDLREAATDGKDMVEALAEAVDCLGSALAHRLANKEEVPYPSKPKRGRRLVPVPLWIAPKIALYWSMKEAGVNRVELARKLGVRETVVRRMLDPDHATRSEKIQAALEKLGKRFLVVVEDAA
jgi:antitoxin HicB